MIGGLKRRGRAGLLLLTLGAPLWACGQSPSELARDYLANLKLGRYQACYRLLSRRDRLAQTVDEFVANMPLAPDVDRTWFALVEEKTQYALDQDVRVHGLNAVVRVKVTTIDLPLWERAVERVFGSVDGARVARELLARDVYPRLSYDDELVMVKELHRWKLFADLAGYERIARLHREALRLYHEHRFDDAAKTYGELLKTLESSAASGAKGVAFRYSRELALVEAARAQAPQAELYLRKLRLAKVRRAMTSDGGAGVFAQITNLGDKPVDEVRVALAYYPESGVARSPLFAATYTAFANPIEFTGFLAPPSPLLPGQTRSFGLQIDVPVPIQESAVPKLTVTSLIFPPWSTQTLREALPGLEPWRRSHNSEGSYRRSTPPQAPE